MSKYPVDLKEKSVQHYLLGIAAPRGSCCPDSNSCWLLKVDAFLKKPRIEQFCATQNKRGSTIS